MMLSFWLRLIIISGVGVCPALSQSSKFEDYRWSIVKRSGEILGPCAIDSIGDNTLHVRLIRSPTSEIRIDSVTSIIREHDSQFLLGAGVGFLSGAVLGGMIGYFSNSSSDDQEWSLVSKGFSTAGGAMYGSILGIGVGGIIGSVAGSDDEILLDDVEAPVRAERLRSWIHEVE
jgi:hypothetical protein